MMRRLGLLATVAMVAAPLIGPGPASASGVDIAHCTSFQGSAVLHPGLNGDRQLQTATLPDTVSGANPDAISGCTPTPPTGPVPKKGTWTASLASPANAPLGCPSEVGGPPDYAPGTIVLTGTAHIVWNSGPATDGRVTMKQVYDNGLGQTLQMAVEVTSGQFFRAGHVTKLKVVLRWTPNQTLGTFSCNRGGVYPPLQHLNLGNIGDEVTRSS
jgi:hypothetical protein